MRSSRYWGDSGPCLDFNLFSPQAFQEELAQFREQLDTHRDPVSCALVALMAHGGPQGQLLGADGQEVQPEALVQELNCCGALRGCPKIFLLQACRGGEWDLGPSLEARLGPSLQPGSSCPRFPHPAFSLPGLVVQLLQEA